MPADPVPAGFKLPTRKLLTWFRRNKRSLPWRDNPTAYSVWVSEVMLQQTVVAAVIGHFERWMKRFPSLSTLAAAEETEVTRYWEGLGYYSRARNLRKGAVLVVANYDGDLPDQYEDLREIPGIGDYTASAILSIAHGKPYPVVDANVRRVMRRVMLLREWNKRAEHEVRKFLSDNMPRKKPGEFNEALMELGQVVCRRSNPDCSLCPLTDECLARKEGMQGFIPLRKKRSVERLATTLLICLRNDEVLLTRSDSKLFRGLWLFPGVPVSINETSKPVRPLTRLTQRMHFYTRFADKLDPIVIRATDVPTGLRREKSAKWVEIEKLHEYPMPSVYRRIATELSNWNKSRS